MGLTKYGLAAAIGYHLGQPHGRQQLRWLRQQIIGLASNLVTRKLRVKSTTAPAPTPSPVDGAAPNGFGGRTVAEDSQAAITGIVPPPPAGRVAPSP
jgi:hypothetical protein